jgi:hypothetical protein
MGIQKKISRKKGVVKDKKRYCNKICSFDSKRGTAPIFSYNYFLV